MQLEKQNCENVFDVNFDENIVSLIVDKMVEAMKAKIERIAQIYDNYPRGRDWSYECIEDDDVLDLDFLEEPYDELCIEYDYYLEWDSRYFVSFDRYLDDEIDLMNTSGYLLDVKITTFDGDVIPLPDNCKTIVDRVNARIPQYK